MTEAFFHDLPDKIRIELDADLGVPGDGDVREFADGDGVAFRLLIEGTQVTGWIAVKGRRQLRLAGAGDRWMIAGCQDADEGIIDKGLKDVAFGDDRVGPRLFLNTDPFTNVLVFVDPDTLQHEIAVRACIIEIGMAPTTNPDKPASEHTNEIRWHYQKLHQLTASWQDSSYDSPRWARIKGSRQSGELALVLGETAGPNTKWFTQTYQDITSLRLGTLCTVSFAFAGAQSAAVIDYDRSKSAYLGPTGFTKNVLAWLARGAVWKKGAAYRTPTCDPSRARR